MSKLNSIALIVILILFFGAPSAAQVTHKIESKNKELYHIKKEIGSLQKEFKKLSSKEKSAVKKLDNIGQQVFLVQDMIKKTSKEISSIKSEITNLTKNISELEQNKKEANEALNKYARWLYESRDVGLLDFLIDSKSFNEAYDKVYYFIFFNRSIQKKIRELSSIEEGLEFRKNKLREKEKDLHRLVANKLKNVKELKKKSQQQKRLLAKIRRSKKDKAQLIKEKKRSEAKIADLINRLVLKAKRLEEARKKRRLSEARAKEEAKKTRVKEKINYPRNIQFAKMKGKLPWPVSGGRIVKKFGKVLNRKLNTVTVNSGIDIKTKAGKPVRAVAGGVVSIISWLPGFGSVVIISHNKTNRTVYGHLTDITVEEGDRVYAGEKLGNVSEGVEGSILHFEVWNGRKYENPNKWLAGR